MCPSCFPYSTISIVIHSIFCCFNFSPCIYCNFFTSPTAQNVIFNSLIFPTSDLIWLLCFADVLFLSTAVLNSSRNENFKINIVTTSVPFSICLIAAHSPSWERSTGKWYTIVNNIVGWPGSRGACISQYNTDHYNYLDYPLLYGYFFQTKH